MKKYIFVVAFFFISYLVADTYMIDFSRIPYSDPYKGQIAPDGVLSLAPETSIFFEKMRDQFKIQTIVETGTHMGLSTKLFSLIFEDVHTIELADGYYQLAKSYFASSPNIHLHAGNSPKVLEDLLPTLASQTVLFYLDAHWYDSWPLLDELKEIGRTHKDNCIVVIDDIKVPGRPDIQYDAYAGIECTYEYIQERLKEVFTEYDCFYLIPNYYGARAKLAILPKKWGFKF